MSIDSLQPMAIWKSYIKKYPGHAIMQCIFTLVYPTQSLFNPIKFAQVVQSVQEGKGLAKSLAILGVFNVIFLILNLSSFTMTADMNITMQAHVISEVLMFMFDTRRLDTDPVHNGRIISTIRSYATDLTNYMGYIQRGVVPTIISLLLQAFYLMSIDKILASCVLGIAIAASIAFGTTTAKPKRNHGGNMYEFVDEILLNIDIVVSHDTYEHELDKLKDITTAQRDCQKHANKTAMRTTTAMNLLLVIMSAIYIARLNVLLRDGNDDIKEATTAITIFLEVVRRSDDMLNTIYKLTNTRASMKNSVNILNDLVPPTRQAVNAINAVNTINAVKRQRRH
jgi:ABC-type multidrug transport system fused ATPase/permease subunit